MYAITFVQYNVFISVNIFKYIQVLRNQAHEKVHEQAREQPHKQTHSKPCAQAREQAR